MVLHGGIPLEMDKSHIQLPKGMSRTKSFGMEVIFLKLLCSCCKYISMIHVISHCFHLISNYELRCSCYSGPMFSFMNWNCEVVSCSGSSD